MKRKKERQASERYVKKIQRICYDHMKKHGKRGMSLKEFDQLFAAK